jgi:hypothetical protein
MFGCPLAQGFLTPSVPLKGGTEGGERKPLTPQFLTMGLRWTEELRK